jgi:hypothetical protein
MTIKLDLSPSTVVVWCTECPWFQDLTTARVAAHNLAVDHEVEAHPESRRARDTRDLYLKRHAVNSQNVGT